MRVHARIWQLSARSSPSRKPGIVLNVRPLRCQGLRRYAVGKPSLDSPAPHTDTALIREGGAVWGRRAQLVTLYGAVDKVGSTCHTYVIQLAGG